MPRVLFKSGDSVEKSARMFTPSQITKESAWLKEARRVIPTIPDPKKTDWRITEAFVTIATVRFEMANSVGQRATVTIDRKYPGFG